MAVDLRMELRSAAYTGLSRAAQGGPAQAAAGAAAIGLAYREMIE
jgi:hypothetical protein